MPARRAPWTTTPRRDGDAAARGKPADRLVRDARRTDRARPPGAGRRAAAARRGACRARSRAGHDPLDPGRRCRRLPRVSRGPRGRAGPDRSRRRGRPGRAARAVRGHDRRPRRGDRLRGGEPCHDRRAGRRGVVPGGASAASEEGARTCRDPGGRGRRRRPGRPAVATVHRLGAPRAAARWAGAGQPAGRRRPPGGVPDRPGRARRGDGSRPRDPP